MKTSIGGFIIGHTTMTINRTVRAARTITATIGRFVLAFVILLSCSGAGAVTTYTYDKLERLTKVDYGNGATIAYSYDAAGNRTSTTTVVAAPAAVLDVDASVSATKYDALTDGLLILRYLFGLSGPGLTSGATGVTASRGDPAAVKTWLDTNRLSLDVDGNGTADALTDGLLIIRYLFGLRGNALIANAVDPLGIRKSATDIENYIETLKP